MALLLSLARVPAFARPLKCSHTLTPSLSRRGRGVSGLVPAEIALWVSVPSRYTWPISLTNENACPLTSRFCSVYTPVSQAPQGRRELLVGDWESERVGGFTGSKSSVNHEVEDNEKPWSQNKGRSNVSSPLHGQLCQHEPERLREYGCI